MGVAETRGSHISFPKVYEHVHDTVDVQGTTEVRAAATAKVKKGRILINNHVILIIFIRLL